MAYQQSRGVKNSKRFTKACESVVPDVIVFEIIVVIIKNPSIKRVVQGLAKRGV